MLTISPFDVLANNAGLQVVAPLESFSQDQWGRFVDVLLHRIFLMTRSILESMRTKGSGHIVNIGLFSSIKSWWRLSSIVAS
ncbi:MAG: SDR family NAD(P)-dependent oxidoreductase [Pirellulales bacterium]|nr:SDR family NAD(P)-dependent oxidoreductase [Pirellulales bacterium]